MKKTLSLLLAMIMLLSSLPLTGVSVFAATSGDYEYSVSNGQATITRYQGRATNVAVPSKIGGYPVTSIGDSAFEYNYHYVSITHITIPNSVKKIGSHAFKGNSKLKSISIPSSVNSIGIAAFEDCISLESITLPNGITEIGDFMFGTCKSLKSVNIPGSVKRIGKNAFNSCLSLKGITIPNSVKEIDLYAFSGCKFKSITIPKSVIRIGKMAVGYGVDGFVICGARNSVAKKYANDNAITFKETGTFPDVKPGTWYYEPVEYVAEMGYMSGYSNGYFGPGDMLKRQDFVVILARLAGKNLSDYSTAQIGFSDVNKSAYYAPSVAWAVKEGVVKGYANGKFGVGNNINREEVATLLYRFKGSPEVKNVDAILSKFSDADKISSYARTALAWAVQNNIISGMADGRIASSEGASRAQIAAIIQRMDQKGMFPADYTFRLFAGEYTFTSGVGFWSTEMTVKSDGSFYGIYHDSDMGSGGNGYNTTMYYCDFSGKFKNPKKINSYTYSFEIDSIKFKNTPNTEEIKTEGSAKVRYVYTDAYGLDCGAKTIYAYTPDAPVALLPDGFMSWVGNLRRYTCGDVPKLSHKCLYAVEPEYGWIGEQVK